MGHWVPNCFYNSYLLNLYFRTVQARLLATTAVKLGIRQKIAHWIIKVLTLTWRAIIVIKLDTVKEIVPRKKVSFQETFLYSRPEVISAGRQKIILAQIFCSFLLVKSDKKMDLECYHCKETGHLSRDCTKEGGIACYNCCSKGHLSRNCTQR